MPPEEYKTIAEIIRENIETVNSFIDDEGVNKLPQVAIQIEENIKTKIISIINSVHADFLCGDEVPQDVVDIFKNVAVRAIRVSEF